MAYSNAWSNVIPAGSDALNTADDQIRQLRLDVQERMDDVVADWTADPVVLTLTRAVARVWSGAAVSLLTTVSTVIPFVQETIDTGSFHDNATNPSRLTITDAGYYRVGAVLAITSGATAANGKILIKKNGVTIAQILQNHQGGTLIQGFNLEVIDLAAAADYYECFFVQSSGDTWTVRNAEDEAFFQIEQIFKT